MNEAQLVEWARHGTAWQLERIARGYRHAKAASEPSVRARRRSVTWSYDDEGCLVIRARLEPDEGAVVLRALDAAMAEVAADEKLGDVPAETSVDEDLWALDASEPFERRRADGFVRLCESYLSSGTRLRSASKRHLVVLHIDKETIARGRADVDNVPLHPETARRLACDGSLLPAHDEHAVGVGRRARIVPRRMRRALRARDGTCRFPSCTSGRNDAHHIVHWAHGGKTCLDNLILLCRRHHRFVHEHGFSIERLGSGSFLFRRPDGKPIERILARGDAGELERSNRETGLDITADTCATDWDGRTPDYDGAVWGLCLLDERAAADRQIWDSSERPDYVLT